MIDCPTISPWVSTTAIKGSLLECFTLATSILRRLPQSIVPSSGFPLYQAHAICILFFFPQLLSNDTPVRLCSPTNNQASENDRSQPATPKNAVADASERSLQVVCQLSKGPEPYLHSPLVLISFFSELTELRGVGVRCFDNDLSHEAWVFRFACMNL